MPRPRLYVIGDSHSLCCFAGVRRARLCHIGAITMHRVGRDGIESILPWWCRPRAEDITLFSFGEIDCREHVQRIGASQGRSVDDVLTDLADRYFRALDHFAHTKRLSYGLLSVIPPLPGAETIQVDLRRMLNAKPSERAAARGLPVVSTAAAAGPDGFMLPDLASTDGIHIRPERNKVIVEVAAQTLGVQLAHSPVTHDPARYSYLHPARRYRKLFTDPLRDVLSRLRVAAGKRDGRAIASGRGTTDER